MCLVVSTPEIEYPDDVDFGCGLTMLKEHD